MSEQRDHEFWTAYLAGTQIDPDLLVELIAQLGQRMKTLETQFETVFAAVAPHLGAEAMESLRAQHRATMAEEDKKLQELRRRLVTSGPDTPQ
jgi:hypothetical protein